MPNASFNLHNAKLHKPEYQGRHVCWHEFASKTVKQKLTVGREGAKLQLAVGGDRVPSAFVPDKYGKPRQAQIGY